MSLHCLTDFKDEVKLGVQKSSIKYRERPRLTLMMSNMALECVHISGARNFQSFCYYQS